MKRGRKKSLISLLIVLVVAGVFACMDMRQGEPEGMYKVLRAVDGDTIVIEMDGKEEKVRLIGVDTPESVHPDAEKNVEYGKIASDYTKEMLEGKYVSLEYDVEEHDRYGRILAYVYIDGQMFNKMLLAEGHAKIATYPPNVKYVDDFTELQKIARAEEKGVWSYSPFTAEKPVPSGAKTAETGYVGNANSKVFHKENCSSVDAIKEANRVPFDDRQTAVDAGYEPCGRCKP